MKKIKAFEETNYIFIEKFLSQHVNLILEEQNPASCTLYPSDIKNILMRNPESLENVNKFIEYLIMNNKTSSDDIISLNSLESPSLSYDEIMKTLSIFQYLGEKMIKIMNCQQIPELNTFFVKPLENDENYNQGTLIFTYTILIEIIRSNFHYKNATYDKKYENLSQIHELLKNYSIQSNFSPLNSILIQKIDNNSDINTLLKGIAPGSSEIFRRGIISNGHFLFVLHSHFYLSLFPICIENGGLFSPLICKLKVDSNAEDVSLSLESNKMVVTAGSYQFKFDIKTLIESSTFSIDEQCQEIEPTEKVRIQNKEYFVSDGVVNVTFNQSKGKTLATIKFVDTQKVINIVCLHKKEGDENLYQNYPLDDFNDLFSWPFETNGLVLSFYIKINPNQILCRQFSLIDGSHIKDEIIDSNINISAISFDSINQIHYTAINNNNQLIIYSLSGSFDCSVNPFLFGFSIPDLDQNLLMKQKKLSLFQSKDVFLKSEKEMIYQISSILLSSIFLKKDVCTFLIDDRDNVFVFPLFIEEIVQSMNDHSNSVDKSKETIMNNIKIAALQMISILFVINVKHHIQLTKDQEFITKIQSSLIKMFHELIQIKEQYLMSVISYIYLNLFEYIDFTGVTEESQVFVSILGELLCYFSPVQIKFVIHVLFENSEKFSSLSFIKFSDKNIFNKYIAGNFPLSKIHPNILSFLLCHQRCVVNQLNKSLEKEHFSAYSLFADINYKDCKTGNESLNNFAEYTNFIVNQFTNSIAYSSSYDIIEKTVIHYLFDNFLMLIIGLYKYHEVAQVVTPMLFLIQTAIKNNIDLSKEENENALQIINKIGIVFGVFTGTLIKGGNLSFYDEKYKWLIRPNMHLITEPNKLYELDNPTINLESFINHNVKLFLSHSSDELINGKNILQDIYKKWNFNMNKNLNQTLLDLDQLFLATELYHLNLFEEAKKRNINKLRPALHQMMRVRNTARSILRSKESSRNIWILNEENIPINEKERSNYSPFDLIVIKCKMLLRLTSKFDSENIADAPKLIADFVLSNDQPSMLINYISNQRNRLRLTDIGFSLLEESYSLKMHDLFLRVIDTTLSISVDNFDGLSTIILYDNEHKAEEHIYKFIRKVLDNIEYPYLILISYKLIESNILSNDLLGKIIEEYMNKSCENITFFALFHSKIHLVKNISDSKLFLFEDSKTGNKVSFNSLPIDDYYKITADEWYFLSQSPDKSTKSYSNVLQYFVNSDFNNDLKNLDSLVYLSRYINSFYEDFSESIQLDSVKKDFSLLLKSLGESLSKNTNFERANEIVSFFRRILNKHNKHSTLLIEIIQSFNKNKFAYDNDSLCAIFAILGGFIDVTQLYNIVTFRINRETLKTGILLNQNEVLEIPININSKPIKTSSYYATSLVPFSCSMFPDSKFIFSFIKCATNNLTNPILSFYLKSLTFYLNEDSDFTLQDAKYLFGKIYSLMKPFDTIKDTEQIISILNSKKKVEPLKDCHFSILANQSTNCTTYLSPILKNNTLYKIKIESFDGFIGYFGFINDDPLSKHIPFLIFDSINGNVIPDYCNKTNEKILNNCSSSKILEFSVDPARKSLIINDKSKTYSYNIESTKSSQYLKIFINAVNSTQIKSIQVFSPSSNSSNSMNQYAYNNNNLYTKINNNNKNNSTSIIKLINFIKPITYKIEDIYVNLNRVDERDYPSFSIPNYIDIPFNPLISNKQILYHYSMADTISTDLKNYICKHVHLKLLGQLATLIIMKFVNIGFGDILLNFSNNIYSIKLFSYLQIPLEPFNNDKLIQKEFPFSLDKSILNDKSSFIPNQQFDNIEFEMKKCLQKIITLHPKIQETIKFYIDSLMNSLLVQTLRNRSNVESYHFYKPTFNYEFSRTSNIESIIIFFPYLYQFNEKYIRLNQALVEFPYILNMNNNDNDEITIEYMQKTDISFFSIDKYNNHWVFESPFEILLLLKEYYLIFKDSLYVRQTLIDLFIMNSPIVSVFVPKLLKYYSEKSFLRKKQFTQDYLKQLYIVQLIQKKYPNKKDADLTVFMSNEHEIYKSPFLALLVPYFPEFFGMYDDDMLQQDSNELISMPLTNLDSKLIYNPLQIFTKCTSIFKEKFNLIYYLQIWLSVSLLYMNNNSDIEIIVEDSNAERSSFQCKFNPSQIHDIFLNEMKIVQNEIKKDYITQFAYSIHYSLLTQNSFKYLLENSLNNFDHISLLPRRVVVIIIYIIYQINYLCSLHENLIPKSEIDSVSNLLNFTTTFLKLIVVNESNANYISINRFEAHRMEIDGNGNQKSSIIAQVSDMLSSNPENFQQKESNVWHVRFINEKALDAGGPTRELYTEIASSIIEKTSGLFIISPNGRNNVGKSNKNVYIPFHTKPENKKLIELNQKEIEKCYVAVGVYLGIIIRNGFYQDLPFAPIVWKLIINQNVDENDIFSIDEDFKDFIINLRNASNDIDLFEKLNQPILWNCINWDGSIVGVPNQTSSNTVTFDTLNIFIDSCIKLRIDILKKNVDKIYMGFSLNTGVSKFPGISWLFISNSIQGPNTISIDQLKSVILIAGNDIKNKFWTAVEQMNDKQRSLLIRFATGFAKIPSNRKYFQIMITELPNSNRLPQAATCFKNLSIPNYDTSEIMLEKLVLAIESCQTMEEA